MAKQRFSEEMLKWRAPDMPRVDSAFVKPWEEKGPFSGMLAVAAAQILREPEPDFYSKSIPEMLKEQADDE